jgi:hypothetical protein
MQIKLRLLGITLSVILLSFVTTSVFGQAVQTDKQDYYPGEYVIITGSGWTPGETVTLHFDETPKPATCVLSHDFTAVADANGNIYNNQFLIKENHRGVLFHLTATEAGSALEAFAWFTDATISSNGTGGGNWNSAGTWEAASRAGTIAYTNLSTAVVGTGTLFTSQLAIGSIIITTGGGAMIRTVASITDDTHLTLTAAAPSTQSGKSYTAQVVPFAGDAVVITEGDLVTVDVITTCASLIVDNPNTSGDSRLTIGAFTLSVTGNVSMTTRNNASSLTTILFNNNNSVLDIGGNLNIGSNNSGISTFDLANSPNNPTSILKIAGSMTRNGTAITAVFASGTNSTVDFTGTAAAQTINVTNFNYANIQIDNTHASGATLGANVTGTNVTGNIAVNTGTLGTGTFAIAGNAGKTFSVANGATFKLTGTSLMVTGFGTKTFGPTSTVEYGGVAQTISAESYGHLTFSGTGGKNLSAGTTTIAGVFKNAGGNMDPGTSTVLFTGNPGIIDGGSAKNFNNLSINAGANVSTTASAGNISINGVFTNENNGVFSQNSAQTTFFGGSSQSLTGTGSTTFGNVTIQSTSTVNAGSHNFTVGGTFSVSSGGTFNGGTGTVSFAGTSSMGSGAGTYNFNNLTIVSGTLSNNTNNKNFNVIGDWTNNGTYTAGTEIISFTGAAQNISGNNSTTFNSLTLAGSGVKTLDKDISVNGTLSLSSANLDVNGKTLNVIGNSISVTGAKTISSTGNGIVDFSTGSSKTISGSSTPLLSFGNTVTVRVAKTLNFGAGISTINGTLELNTNAFINTNGPTYANGSTLLYKNATYSFSNGAEWNAPSGPGFPYHVVIDNSGVQLAAANRSIAGNLSLINGGSITGDNGRTITVPGNVLNDLNGAINMGFVAGSDFYVGGNWTDNNTSNSAGFKTNSGNSVLRFYGTNNSSINVPNLSAQQFQRLSIEKTSGATSTLNNNIQVNANLALSSILTTAGSNVITMQQNATITRTTGHINGSLALAFANPSNLSRTFDIGDATNYTPVSINVASVSVPSHLVVKTTPGEHSSILTSSIDPGNSVNRNWTITNTGLVFSNATVTLNYLLSDLDGGATFANFSIGKYDGTTWTYPAISGTPTNSSITATGINSFSSFAVGKKKNSAPEGTDNSVTTDEDVDYTFASANFGFTDPNDAPANSLLAVKITTLPANGILKLSGSPVSAGDFISAANITAGNLKFSPATNANGSPYSSLTFQVQDDGGTASSGVDLDPTPNTITINVSTVNDAPVLAAIGAQSGDEQTAITFTASATDVDLPANTLSYSLANATGGGTYPTGASINAATGAFTWTPSEAQGPGTFKVKVVVTDNGTPALSDDEDITITVNEVNIAPVLAAIGNKNVAWNNLLSFTASASDVDLPANTLTYSLIGAPVGASIVANTGAFTWTPTNSQIGLHTFKVKVIDNGTPAKYHEEEITVTVSQRVTKVVYQANGATTAQYSDPAALKAKLFDITNGLPGTPISSKTISFTIGTQSISDATDANGLAEASLTLTQYGNYSLVSAFAGDADYAASSCSTTFIITKEDADIAYTGSQYFPATLQNNVYKGNMEYIASFTDRADGSAGDITKAKAGFTGNNTINNVAVKLISQNSNTGEARVLDQTTLSNSDVNAGGKSFNLFVNAQGDYYQADEEGPIVITVAIPGKDYVNGGGYVIATNPIGIPDYTPALGSKINFGFTMKWNKSGKSIQGQSNIIFRRWVNNQWRIYQVKSNAINTLATATATDGRRADFNTKANCSDITNPLNPIPYLGGNLDLTVSAFESTVSGVKDQIVITLRSSTGEILFCNNWIQNKPTLQPLGGGSIKVLSTITAPIAPVARINTSATSTQVDTPAPTLFFDIKASPNPTTSHFNVKLESDNISQPISMNVVDISGKVIEMRKNLVAGQTFQLGANYRPGMYFVELLQGDRRRIVKLVKQPD